MFRPYTILMFLLVVTLWWSLRKLQPRRKVYLCGLLMGGLWLLSMPLVGRLALRTLTSQYPPLIERPAGDAAIVILGGGLQIPASPDRDAEPLPSAMTLVRTMHGARLYGQGEPCLVVTCGGIGDPRRPEWTLAEVMRDLLIRFGVDAEDVVLEDSSRTTYENAVETAKLLQRRGVDRVLLVTDAPHLPRAVRCFTAQGLDVIPAACRYPSPEGAWRLEDFLPSPYGPAATQRAAHEWLGIAQYWWQGKFSPADGVR